MVDSYFVYEYGLRSIVPQAQQNQRQFLTLVTDRNLIPLGLSVRSQTI